MLTYAIEIVHVSDRDERRQLRVAYNSVFRKIFGYRWSESVSALQQFLNRPTWEELVDKRRLCFLDRILNRNDGSLARGVLSIFWNVLIYQPSDLFMYSFVVFCNCATLTYLSVNIKSSNFQL